MTHSSKPEKPTLPFALRIRRERKLHSWSQEDLAEKVGTAALSVSRWERGVAFPSPYYQQRLCEAFGKAPQELGFVPEDVEGNAQNLQMPASSESHGEDTSVMPSTREEVTAAPLEQSMNETHQVRPLLSRSNLLLLGAILLLLAVSSTGILYFVEKAGSIPLLVHPLATGTTQASSPSLSSDRRTYPPPHARLVLNDPLRKNTRDPVWQEGSYLKGGSCTFTGGAYHVAISQVYQFWYCPDYSSTFSDFVYQVQMAIIKGDEGGIGFRISGPGSLYYFYIDTQGHYELDVNENHNLIRAIRGGSSPAIKTGYNQPNLIAVVAQGESFDLYVNLQHLAHASDAHFRDGQISVLANEGTHPTEVVFSNAKVWEL